MSDRSRIERNREQSRQNARSRSRAEDDLNSQRLLAGTLSTGDAPKSARRSARSQTQPKKAAHGLAVPRKPEDDAQGPATPHDAARAMPASAAAASPSDSMLDPPEGRSSSSAIPKVKRLAPREAAERALAKMQMVVQIMNLERIDPDLGDVRRVAKSSVPEPLDLREELVKRYVKPDFKPSQYFSSSFAQMRTLLDGAVDEANVPTDAVLDEEEAQVLRDMAEAFKRKKMAMSACHCREGLEQELINAHRAGSLEARVECTGAFARTVTGAVTMIRAMELNLDERDREIREKNKEIAMLNAELEKTQQEVERVKLLGPGTDDETSGAVRTQEDLSLLNEAQYLDRERRLYVALKRVKHKHHATSLGAILQKEFGKDGTGTSADAPWVHRFLRRTELIHDLRKRLALSEQQTMLQHDSPAKDMPTDAGVQTLREDEIVGTKAWERKNRAGRVRVAVTSSNPADLVVSGFDVNATLVGTPVERVPISLMDGIRRTLDATKDCMREIDQVRVESMQSVYDTLDPRQQAKAIHTCYQWQSQLESSFTETANELRQAITSLVNGALDALSLAKHVSKTNSSAVTPAMTPPLPSPRVEGSTKPKGASRTPPPSTAPPTPAEGGRRGAGQLVDAVAQTDDVQDTRPFTPVSSPVTPAAASPTTPSAGRSPSKSAARQLKFEESGRRKSSVKPAAGGSRRGTISARPTTVDAHVLAQPDTCEVGISAIYAPADSDGSSSDEDSDSEEAAVRRAGRRLEVHTVHEANRLDDGAQRIVEASRRLVSSIRSNFGVLLPRDVLVELHRTEQSVADEDGAAPRVSTATATLMKCVSWLEAALDSVKIKAQRQEDTASKPSSDSTSKPATRQRRTRERTPAVTKTPPPAALPPSSQGRASSEGFECVPVEPHGNEVFDAATPASVSRVGTAVDRALPSSAPAGPSSEEVRGLISHVHQLLETIDAPDLPATADGLPDVAAAIDALSEATVYVSLNQTEQSAPSPTPAPASSAPATPASVIPPPSSAGSDNSEVTAAVPQALLSLLTRLGVDLDVLSEPARSIAGDWRSNGANRSMALRSVGTLAASVLDQLDRLPLARQVTPQGADAGSAELMARVAHLENLLSAAESTTAAMMEREAQLEAECSELRGGVADEPAAAAMPSGRVASPAEARPGLGQASGVLSPVTSNPSHVVETRDPLRSGGSAGQAGSAVVSEAPGTPGQAGATPVRRSVSLLSPQRAAPSSSSQRAGSSALRTPSGSQRAASNSQRAAAADEKAKPVSRGSVGQWTTVTEGSQMMDAGFPAKRAATAEELLPVVSRKSSVGAASTAATSVSPSSHHPSVQHGHPDVVDRNLVDLIRGLTPTERAVATFELVGEDVIALHRVLFDVIINVTKRLKLPAMKTAVDPLAEVTAGAVPDVSEVMMHDRIILSSLRELLDSDSRAAVAKMQRTFERIKCRIERRAASPPTSRPQSKASQLRYLESRDTEFVERQKRMLAEREQWLDEQREIIRQQQRQARKEWTPWQASGGGAGRDTAALPVISMKSVVLRDRDDPMSRPPTGAPPPRAHVWPFIEAYEDPYVALFKVRVRRWLSAKRSLFERRRRLVGHPPAARQRVAGGITPVDPATIANRPADKAMRVVEMLHAAKRRAAGTPAAPAHLGAPTVTSVPRPKRSTQHSLPPVKGSTPPPRPAPSDLVHLSQETFATLKRRVL